MRIPKEYNYISAFLTLKCNYSCTYCINGKSDSLKRKRHELGTDLWIEGLNRLEIKNDLAITIGGGEPTLHPGFYKIMNELNHPVDLLTNLSFDVQEFISSVDHRKMFRSSTPSYKSIRVSYHPKFMNRTELVLKCEALQDAGFNIGIFPINYPDNVEPNMKLAEEARKARVYTFIKDYLGVYNGHLHGHYKYRDSMDGRFHGNIECRTKELLISPSGQVYKCHRDLYAGEYTLGNICYPDFKAEYKFRECNKYGNCNPCDVKEKTNRFLEMGACSVEIKGK
jgi:MoaA/NifB/PqqE/SkfB family radical SAM enzyme